MPTTRILHLGAVVDSVSGHAFLSPDCILSIHTLGAQILTLKSVRLIMLSLLLGKLISCIAIVPWARLHARPLQWYLLPYQRSCHASSKAKDFLPASVRLSLRWWLSLAIKKGCCFQEPDRGTITTDASMFGLGAHLQSDVTRGRWSPEDLKNDINWLELRAVHLVLRHFRSAGMCLFSWTM